MKPRREALVRKSGGEAMKPIGEPPGKAMAKSAATAGRNRHGRSLSLPKLMVLPRPGGRRTDSDLDGEGRTGDPSRAGDSGQVAEHARPDLGPPLAPLHFGDSLRQARQQLGLSVHDVAQKTRISGRWIEALEAAQLEGLPAPVFVSGYLRSYAKAVGLDGNLLLVRYRELIEQRGLAAALAERGAHLAGHRAATWRRPLLFFGLALLIVFALVIVAWRRGAL
jgi:transcriptional regulator with XRE-family HTH domain